MNLGMNITGTMQPPNMAITKLQAQPMPAADCSVRPSTASVIMMPTKQNAMHELATARLAKLNGRMPSIRPRPVIITITPMAARKQASPLPASTWKVLTGATLKRTMVPIVRSLAIEIVKPATHPSTPHIMAWGIAYIPSRANLLELPADARRIDFAGNVDRFDLGKLECKAAARLARCSVSRQPGSAGVRSLSICSSRSSDTPPAARVEVLRGRDALAGSRDPRLQLGGNVEPIADERAHRLHDEAL